MLGVLVRFLRRCRAAYHGLTGRLAWRFRCATKARFHFERALALGGSEFTAYVHLGRIALGDGDYAGYRREMGNARASDPERFARLRIPTEGLEPRTAGTPFEEASERATWRSVRTGHGRARRPAVRSAELPTDFGTENDDAHLAQHLGETFDNLDERTLEDLGLDEFAVVKRQQRDDFDSPAERDRFRDLPPIRGDEVRDADVDDIARQLGG